MSNRNAVLGIAITGAVALLFGLTAAGWGVAGVILTILWVGAWLYRFWELR
jgi:hypothetical protein